MSKYEWTCLTCTESRGQELGARVLASAVHCLSHAMVQYETRSSFVTLPAAHTRTTCNTKPGKQADSYLLRKKNLDQHQQTQSTTHSTSPSTIPA